MAPDHDRRGRTAVAEVPTGSSEPAAGAVADPRVQLQLLYRNLRTSATGQSPWSERL